MNKKTGLKEAVMKDFWWKMLSLAIAICLWFVVINIENPVETRSFSVPLEIRNVAVIDERDQVISNYNSIEGTKISIKVRGQRLSLDRLFQNRDSIQAYIDLVNIEESGASGAQLTVPVNVKLPSNLNESFEVVSKNPNTITIKIESSTEIEKKVEMIIEGGNGTAYSKLNPEITPQNVKISGTESLVDSVVGVKAVIRAEDVKEDNKYTVNLVPYDKTGTTVSGVSLNPSTVDIYIPIKASKKLKLTSSATGEPASGFVLDSVKCEPEYIYVLGDDAVLSQIEEIKLPPINITGKNTTSEMSFVLKYVLPDGIKLKDGEIERAVVTATLAEESTKDIVLKSDNISFKTQLAEDFVAEVLPEDIHLQIRGTEKALASVTSDDIKGSLSISDMEVGEYRLPITVEVPEGVKLTQAESPYVTVMIKTKTIPEEHN